MLLSAESRRTLKKLIIGGDRIGFTSDWLQAVGERLPALQTFENCPFSSHPDDFKYLCETFTSLEQLDLSHCFNTNPQGISALQNLKSLTLQAVQFPDAQSMAEFFELRKLTYLNIAGGDEEVNNLVHYWANHKGFPELKVLDCAFNKRIPIAHLREIIMRHPKLEVFSLIEGEDPLNSIELSQLKIQGRNVNILSLGKLENAIQALNHYYMPEAKHCIPKVWNILALTRIDVLREGCKRKPEIIEGLLDLVLDICKIYPEDLRIAWSAAKWMYFLDGQPDTPQRNTPQRKKVTKALLSLSSYEWKNEDDDGTFLMLKYVWQYFKETKVFGIDVFKCAIRVFERLEDIDTLTFGSISKIIHRGLGLIRKDILRTIIKTSSFTKKLIKVQQRNLDKKDAAFEKFVFNIILATFELLEDSWAESEDLSIFLEFLKNNSIPKKSITGILNKHRRRFWMKLLISPTHKSLAIEVLVNFYLKTGNPPYDYSKGELLFAVQKAVKEYNDGHGGHEETILEYFIASSMLIDRKVIAWAEWVWNQLQPGSYPEEPQVKRARLC